MTVERFGTVIDRLTAVREAGQVHRVAVSFLKTHGVSHVNYVDILEDQGAARSERMTFYSNMPESWRSRYDGERMGDRDYTVRRALTLPESGPFLIGPAFLNRCPDMTSAERAFVYTTRDALGTQGALSGRLPDLTPERISGFFLGFNLPPGEIQSLVRDQHGVFVLTMMAVHERMAALRVADALGLDVVTLPRLVDREREILQGLAQGDDGARIGDRLHLAESTVAVHLANARRRLRAKTSEQALVKAILAGFVVS